MVKSKDSILKDYQNNAEIQQSLIINFKKTLNNISYYRLGMLVMEIIFVAIIIKFGYYWPVGVLMGMPVVGFMALLKRQVAVQNKLNYVEKLLFVFQNEIELITTGHQKYDNGKAFADESHPYASDLDIYGASSLYAFINRSNTVEGMQLLADSLGGPAKKTDITDRQEAIAELTEHIEKTFHFRAGLQNHKPQQLEVIRHKMEHQMPDQLKFTRNKFIRFYTPVAPVFSIGLLILGCIYGGVMWSFLVVCLLFNGALTFFYSKAIMGVSNVFSGSSTLFNAISGTVKWTEETKWKSSYIQNFFAGGDNTQDVLSKKIKELSGLINSFDAGLNMFIGPFLKAFLLWDFKYAIRLNNWYLNSSAQLIAALHTISQFEEIISFATLAHNEPEWTFPVISDTFCLSVKGLGHPLIREDKRIINDYEFEAQPTADIITGSNMAGKSTFLRTTGINMVLAFSGAPVCAAEMRSSIFELLTYMRIKDSLNDQTSTFKAELNRLKMILEGVRTLQHPLVLIDEMLRGTNSRDKYLG
ncbi:MAG TPA: DNA mismatch repair protein MutS [Pedobacter sp.]